MSSYDFDLNELKAIFQRDQELAIWMDTWEGTLSELYMKCLPEFETFVLKIPDDITVSELEACLREHTPEFRMLFAYRLSQMFEHLQAGSVSLHCESIGGFLRRELYENHPEKINYSPIIKR